MHENRRLCWALGKAEHRSSAQVLEAGLEPAISPLGGRRLIHWATRAIDVAAKKGQGATDFGWGESRPAATSPGARPSRARWTRCRASSPKAAGSVPAGRAPRRRPPQPPPSLPFHALRSCCPADAATGSNFATQGKERGGAGCCRPDSAPLGKELLGCMKTGGSAGPWGKKDHRSSSAKYSRRDSNPQSPP